LHNLAGEVTRPRLYFFSRTPSNSAPYYNMRFSACKLLSLPIQDEPERLRQLVYDWDVQLIMNDGQLQTVEQVRQFLKGGEAVEFRGLTAREKYYWIEEVLIRFKYHLLKRDEKGVLRWYISNARIKEQ